MGTKPMCRPPTTCTNGASLHLASTSVSPKPKMTPVLQQPLLAFPRPQPRPARAQSALAVSNLIKCSQPSNKFGPRCGLGHLENPDMSPSRTSTGSATTFDLTTIRPWLRRFAATRSCLSWFWTIGSGPLTDGPCEDRAVSNCFVWKALQISRRRSKTSEEAARQGDAPKTFCLAGG